MLQTEFEFTLPCGYLDAAGTLHREGTIRRATAADEILPLKDPRVVRNPSYLIVILLARVVTKLGSIEQVNTKVIEDLYATDLAHLQKLYNQINSLEPGDGKVVCPSCSHQFALEGAAAGGSPAIPSTSSTRR
jgi:hypothetical protein